MLILQYRGIRQMLYLRTMNIDVNTNINTYTFFFPPSHVLSSPIFSLPPRHCSSNSDPVSHSRLFPPPRHYGSCLAFLSREDFSSFFQRRLASNCACLHYALSAVDAFFLQKMAGFDLQDQHLSLIHISEPTRPY